MSRSLKTGTTVLLILAGLYFLYIEASYNKADQESIEVSKVVIVYESWTAVTNKKQDWVDLFYKENPNRIVIEDIAKIDEWVALTNQPSYEDLVVRELIDARICVIMFSKQGDPVREVSFGNYSDFPYMEMGAQVFNKNETLFEYTISYLPKNYLEDEKSE